MGKDSKRWKTGELLGLLYGLLIYRVSLVAGRMFLDRMLDYGEKVISFLDKLSGGHKEKPRKKRLITGWPKDFKSFLVMLVQEIGQEDILAGVSLLLLFCFSFLMVYLPKISLLGLLGTIIVFVNIFMSKLLLLSSSVRIMTKKSLFLKPPSISEFLFAFPLDYFGIVVSFANFYLFTSGVWDQALVSTSKLSSSLSFGDSLVYSLSCITTLNLSDAVAATLWLKLLSFAELMLGIFFIVIFGSIIMGLFLTDKETLEQISYTDEKNRFFGPLSEVFGPVVHKLGGLLKDAELRSLESTVSTMLPKPSKKLVVSFSYPNTSRFKGLQLTLPCSRLKDWIEVLPTSAKKKLSDAGLTPDEIARKIEEGALGTLSTIEWKNKNGAKVVVDVSVQES